MSPVLGIVASSNQQGRGGGPVGAYDALATIVNPAATTITFSGIPTGYQHLQIRGMANNGEASGYNNQAMRFNDDTSASYAVHYLAGQGSGSAISGSQVSTTSINDIFRIPVSSTGFFGSFVIDILDYASTTKNKVVRSLNGGDSNGSGWIGLHSGLYYKTDAITSITINSSVGNFGTGSLFVLYGVK